MFKPFLCAVCVVLAVPVSIRAQSNYATLRGSIVDTQQRVIPRAHVQLTSTATGAVRELTADAAGLYVAEGLQPGAYTVEISSEGFASTTSSIQLEVGQDMTLDKRLGVGKQAETVIVKYAPELLKTTDVSVGEVVDQRSVEQLPLNGRQLIDLVMTVPGAHQSMGAQSGDANPLYWRPGQFSAVSISGNRPNANYFLLDGATNTDPTFNTQNLNPSPDIVQEFQVQTGSYSAEMGGAGG
ncbi:MAG: hypothetical protein QOE55_3788, partial [Acidobacteriaceae bacterium]|nr:hypothetical protein [Acidobacteriaceae bacterium]